MTIVKLVLNQGDNLCRTRIIQWQKGIIPIQCLCLTRSPENHQARLRKTTISVNQALFPDTLSILIPKLEGMTKMILDAQEEINKCTKELQDARFREGQLKSKIDDLKFKC